MKRIKINLFILLSIALVNNVIAQVNNVQLYTFGHSLIDHRPPLIPTPSDETTIFHWMYDISQNARTTFAATGQLGQLATHVDFLPANSNLGYDMGPVSWDESTSTFGYSPINTILLTAGNFIQYSPPSNPDPSDGSGRTVINLTETLFDWSNTQKPNMRYYIYANWPEMDLVNAYPPTLPTQSEIDEFHDITTSTTGTFVDWWTDYQDLMLVSRPQYNTRLIPVGMIISGILRDVIPNQIPFDELYEDSDPHGRANIYFLGGMITYMALYHENIPSTYMPSTIISSAIRNNLDTIRNFAWKELHNFNFPSGESRVFYPDGTLNIGANELEEENKTSHISENGLGQNQPNPFTGEVIIPYTLGEKVENAQLEIFELVSGKKCTTIPLNMGMDHKKINWSEYSKGVYIYRLVVNGVMEDSKLMTKMR